MFGFSNAIRKTVATRIVCVYDLDQRRRTGERLDGYKRFSPPQVRPPGVGDPGIFRSGSAARDRHGHVADPQLSAVEHLGAPALPHPAWLSPLQPLPPDL